MRVAGHPRVGDVYVQKYGTGQGRRIRLTRFHDAPVHLKRWYETETVAHPSSPQMVGSKGSASVQSLEDRWYLMRGVSDD